jgi:hypothetical protein
MLEFFSNCFFVSLVNSVSTAVLAESTTIRNYTIIRINLTVMMNCDYNYNKNYGEFIIRFKPISQINCFNKFMFHYHFKPVN